ncbi:efflux RND transporter periplasmic adaptor subunit [Anaeromyxobacter paludicola]|uniref:Antibiotic resistance protein n=1 Tax=Anaeromyxobacter paludicola TaxID=2918171 RepID=A0ABM7XFJ0_9BACT|nr:HlyD family secretion protein [Anaeromyxobacter paludicola]BDG10648.1 antibiotic resistance protein [Anaeromyxobacter paludicola]
MWKTLLRPALTLAVLAVASLAGHALWVRYMYAPWTRDARVRADVIQVAPDVGGQVVEVPVADNQRVRRGDVLFTIDAARYRLAVKQARASLAGARTDRELRRAESSRRASLDGTVVSSENRQAARAAADAAEAREQQAEAALASAELDLERTRVRAPADGYVTNLGVHPGSYAVAGHPMLAVVDARSFRVEGYFEETKLAGVQVGAPVDVRLMSGGQRLRGRVASIARAIGEPEVEGLLSNVNPTFHWVRLAQRIPVRIALDPAAEVAALAAGMTCTVTVRPGAGQPALAMSPPDRAQR